MNLTEITTTHDAKGKKMQTTAQIIDRAKAEVIEDVKAGIVPTTITRAHELHDYVDANKYGGMCAENFGDDIDQTIDTGNAMFEALDAWIVAGGLYKEA